MIDGDKASWKILLQYCFVAQNNFLIKRFNLLMLFREYNMILYILPVTQESLCLKKLLFLFQVKSS